jgi:hypothetical protein
MSDPNRRGHANERAETSDPAVATAPAVPSPLAEFLDDAETALSELREVECAKGPAKLPR